MLKRSYTTESTRSPSGLRSSHGAERTSHLRNTGKSEQPSHPLSHVRHWSLGGAPGFSSQTHHSESRFNLESRADAATCSGPMCQKAPSQPQRLREPRGQANRYPSRPPGHSRSVFFKRTNTTFVPQAQLKGKDKATGAWTTAVAKEYPTR